MQIRFFLPLCAIACLLLPACEQSRNSGGDAAVAVIDLTRAMRDCEAGKAGVKFLEERQGGMEQKIKALQEKLQKNPKDEATQKEFQTAYMQVSQQIQAEQQNVVNLLLDTIQRVTNSYREQKGYRIILNSDMAASFDAKIDVTDDIIAEVNKQKVDFKPLPDPAPPQAVVPAPAADSAPADNTPTEQPEKPARDAKPDSSKK